MGQALLLVGAGLARAGGAALRETRPAGPHEPRAAPARTLGRLVGWPLCLLGSWLAISAAGAWFPVWPALALGLAGALLELAVDVGRGRVVEGAGRPRPAGTAEAAGGVPSARRTLRVGADLLLVLAAGLASVPPLPLLPLLGLALVIAGLGWGVDRAAGRLPGRPRLAAAVVLPLLLAAGYHALARGGDGLRSMFEVWPHVGVTPSCEGERITLSTGAAGWMDRPPPETPSTAALVFHGANPAGSRQPAACVLRRALATTGLLVLSVDHPGYGLSPPPGADAPVSGWNPLPTGRAALDRLRERDGVRNVLAIGHSMGAGDVIRLLETEPPLQGAVLFGAGLKEPDACDEYWYGRFHEDRGLAYRVPPERWCEIMRDVYALEPRARDLPGGHPPLLFVRFGIEWPDLAGNRDSLYRMLPEPKSAWTFEESTHYFSSYATKGVLVGDVRVARRLANRLQQFERKVAS